MLGELAFTPLYILIVTLIIHELITRREKHVLLTKLNMVVGTFYSEVGTELLNYFVQFDPDSIEISRDLLRGIKWSEKGFARIRKELDDFEYCFDCKGENMLGVRDFLLDKRNFLLILSENPVLMELESFSELLWGIFHLTEELEKIAEVRDLVEGDFDHLNDDMKTTYILLVMEWLDYMSHLRKEHPYLFSLALRTNPFDPTLVK